MTPMRRAAIALGMAILTLITWQMLPTPEPPPLPAPALRPGPETDSDSGEVPTAEAADVGLPTHVPRILSGESHANANPPVEALWSDERVGTPERYGSLPHDQFGYPLELRPYLHRMMNMARSWGAAEGRDPTSGSYVPKLSAILQSLPRAYQDSAKANEQALAAIVRRFALGAHPLEIEHWRARLHAYHLAIENGDFLVVDNTAYPMTSEGNQEMALNNKRHLDQLNLGVMNQDFFYVTTGGRSTTNQPGQYTTLIYITRTKYPEPFLLLDEVVKLKQQAEREVREYLGIR